MPPKQQLNTRKTTILTDSREFGSSGRKMPNRRHVVSVLAASAALVTRDDTSSHSSFSVFFPRFFAAFLGAEAFLAAFFAARLAGLLADGFQAWISGRLQP